MSFQFLISSEHFLRKTQYADAAFCTLARLVMVDLVMIFALVQLYGFWRWHQQI